MLQGAIFFNGLRFPFAVIDQAFNWARKEGGNLHAVFLISRDTESEGYFFPSDLDAAENLSSDEEALSDTQKIIESNLSMLRHRAKAEGIELRTMVLYDPTDEAVSTTIESLDKIFIPDESDNGSATGSVDIDLNKRLSAVASKVERIKS